MATRKIEHITGADARAHRYKLKMNQPDFWGRLGVTQSGGSRYEAGRPMPAPVRLVLGAAMSGKARDDLDGRIEALTLKAPTKVRKAAK